jgi:hypothetical protein
MRNTNSTKSFNTLLDNGFEINMFDGDILKHIGKMIQTIFDEQGGLIGSGKIRSLYQNLVMVWEKPFYNSTPTRAGVLP